MPGLQFENLPAAQQDPESILKDQYDRTIQYNKSQYDAELSSLQESYLSDKDFHDKLNELNSKHQQIINRENYKADQKLQQVKRVQGLVNAGKIAPDAGKEAVWRLALPSETERAMFQTAGRQQQPYSVATITSKAMMNTISDFAKAAPGKPGLEWGKPEKLQEGLIEQYGKWRELVGYNFLDPIRQYQLDQQWDAYMAGQKQFDKWWVNKGKRKPIAEVKALRTPGKIGKIMRGRLGVGGESTPLGSSIAQTKPQSSKPAFSAIDLERFRKEPTEQVTPQAIVPGSKRQLDRATAIKLFRQTGSKEAARKKAIELGYTL